MKAVAAATRLSNELPAQGGYYEVYNANARYSALMAAERDRLTAMYNRALVSHCEMLIFLQNGRHAQWRQRADGTSIGGLAQSGDERSNRVIAGGK